MMSFLCRVRVKLKVAVAVGFFAKQQHVPRPKDKIFDLPATEPLLQDLCVCGSTGRFHQPPLGMEKESHTAACVKEVDRILALAPAPTATLLQKENAHRDIFCGASDPNGVKMVWKRLLMSVHPDKIGTRDPVCLGRAGRAFECTHAVARLSARRAVSHVRGC
jgi:hypothetical protein